MRVGFLLLVIGTTIAVAVGRTDPSVFLVDGFRPPAVPLVVQSPYTSVWQMSDNLTDAFSAHWSGPVVAFVGLIRIDNVSFRWMGNPSSSPPPMQQKSVKVLPVSTVYTFEQNGIELKVTFTTPAGSFWSRDYETASYPVTYISLATKSVDGKEHNVQIYFDHTGEGSISNVENHIEWSREVVQIPGQIVMRIGSSDQKVLGEKGDYTRINWGYAYLVVDEEAGISTTMAGADLARNAFTSRGAVDIPDDSRMPRACNDDWPVLAVSWDLGKVDATGAERNIIYSYDEIAAIDFFGEQMAPLWRSNNTANQPAAMLSDARNRRAFMLDAADQTNFNVAFSLSSRGGDQYATIGSLAFRQCVGGTVLVWAGSRKEPWMFMKEMSSDGDVSTVDVIYPAAPMLLYSNPDLIRMLLAPILAYANNETSVTYDLPWAPHHLGIWPIADLRPDQQEQMPVEETGNMLLMLAGMAQRLGPQATNSFLGPYWHILEGWANYLNATLPDPGNQLCTDDFEGPSPHNVNLAAKGILGIAAYSDLLAHRSDIDAVDAITQQSEWLALAKTDAKLWADDALNTANGTSGASFRLQYDLPGSWSQKYNLVWQTLLPVAFNSSVMLEEMTSYLDRLLPYGLPLDNRATFTKADWEMWIASIAPQKLFDEIVSRLFLFLHKTPERVPFTDWYTADTGELKGFRARPVIGGVFAPMVFFAPSEL